VVQRGLEVGIIEPFDFLERNRTLVKNDKTHNAIIPHGVAGGRSQASLPNTRAAER